MNFQENNDHYFQRLTVIPSATIFASRLYSPTRLPLVTFGAEDVDNDNEGSSKFKCEYCSTRNNGQPLKIHSQNRAVTS